MRPCECCLRPLQDHQRAGCVIWGCRMHYQIFPWRRVLGRNQTAYLRSVTKLHSQCRYDQRTLPDRRLSSIWGKVVYDSRALWISDLINHSFRKAHYQGTTSPSLIASGKAPPVFSLVASSKSLIKPPTLFSCVTGTSVACMPICLAKPSPMFVCTQPG